MTLVADLAMRFLNMEHAKKGLVGLLALFCLFALSACEREPAAIQMELSGPTMGTHYHVKLIPKVSLVEQDVQAVVDEELRQINQSMSTYIPDSELSQFNRHEVGSWMSVSDRLCALLAQSFDIYTLSERRFDPTIGPLVNLWGFGPEAREGLPSQEELEAAKARVDFAQVEIDCDASRIRRLADVYVDLSATAKGYAADAVGERLAALGVENYMVEVGGEIAVSGLNRQRAKWRIAVEKPSLAQTGAVEVLAVSNVSIATSGEYRNYYEVDGKRVSHTIDPVTGAPITHTLASVTVIHEEGAAADAWATALNVLGPERGWALADTLELSAYFIIKNGEGYDVKATSAFETYRVKP